MIIKNCRVTQRLFSLLLLIVLCIFLPFASICSFMLEYAKLVEWAPISTDMRISPEDSDIRTN